MADFNPESLVLRVGSIRIEVRAEPNEMAWLRPLFTRCRDPFKTLRDMGYEPVEKKDAS
jgi:hypothetical protein